MNLNLMTGGKIIQKITRKILLKNNKNKDEVENTAEFETFIRKGYEDFWNRTMTYEQKLLIMCPY